MFHSIAFLLIMSLTVCNAVADAIPDPCKEENHRQLEHLGSRNEHCVPKDIELNDLLCDQYLPSDWYITKNAVMLNTEPKKGSCGVDTPLWLIDQLPKLSDEIMDRDVCVKTEGDACSEIITIQIKNCSSFYAYKLQQLPESLGCPAAYCFVSKDVCRTPDQLNTKATSQPISTNDGKGKTYDSLSFEEDAKPQETVSNKHMSQADTWLIACQVISGCVIITLIAAIVLVCRNKRPSQVKDGKTMGVEHGPARVNGPKLGYESLRY